MRYAKPAAKCFFLIFTVQNIVNVTEYSLLCFSLVFLLFIKIVLQGMKTVHLLLNFIGLLFLRICCSRNNTKAKRIRLDWILASHKLHLAWFSGWDLEVSVFWLSRCGKASRHINVIVYVRRCRPSASQIIFTEFTEATNDQNTDGISKHRLSPYTSTIYITHITFYLHNNSFSQKFKLLCLAFDGSS